ARDILRRELPDCPVCRLEATYLVWVDVSALMDRTTDIADLLEREAGVRVSPGAMYGDPRFIRLNIAMQRDRMEGALHAVCKTLSKL
ncbi:MAG: hypothetical protein K2H87_01500, partial [Duncaniella sp.]|nr:hypothetical protein [Duncaniella sp.]